MTEQTLSDSLLVRLNEVRKQVLYVQKDTQVQNYRAVTHDMVTAVIRPALVEQEIFFFPSLRSEEVREIGTTKSGAPIHRYEALFSIRIVAPNTMPEDGIELTIPAHGQDTADKAPGKALSMAVKYAQLKALNLETGENEEGRFEDPGKKVISHLKDELDEYIEAGDALGVYLMSKKVGEDIWTDLYNVAPQGKKVAWKKIMTDMESTGLEILQTVNEAIEEEDSLKAKENISDITHNTKRMLRDHIGHERSNALGELMKK